MELIENVLLNVILMGFPLMFYAIYVINNKNFFQKENELLFDFALLTSMYFVIKFGVGHYSEHHLVIANTILIIAYLRNRQFSILLLSTILIFYYNVYFNFSLVLLIIEYCIYYLFYLILKKRNVNIYIIVFSILKIIWLPIYFGSEDTMFLGFDQTFVLGLIILITALVVVFAFKKIDSILNYHLAIKELDKEKQIRSSLFKITHEIKNPIAVCKGYLDMFDTADLVKSEKYVKVMKEEIDRILFMLEDFLSIKEIKLNNEIIDINFLVESVFEKYIFIFKDSDIILENNLLDDEFYIEGDYNRLVQLFVNIVKNAMEALEEKEYKKITITQKIKEDTISIIIKDTGCGMSEEVFKNFTNPFYTTKKRGNGLGVSLSFEIAKSHNGQLSYETKEHEWTKVTLCLPIYKIKE